MIEIVSKILLVGDKFMSEMHSRFTCSTCGPFNRNKKRIEKFMQTGDTDFIYINKLNKACFQHDMANGKSKDLAKRTQPDKVLRDKAFKIASPPKYDGYQRGLASIVYKFLIKNLVEVVLMLTGIINLQMNLKRQIIRKFKRRKVYLSFIDNIRFVDLADMQSLSKYNKGIKYLLCAIDLLSKFMGCSFERQRRN